MDNEKFKIWLKEHSFHGYENLIHIYSLSQDILIGFYIIDILKNEYRKTSEIMIRGVVYDGSFPRRNVFIYRAEIYFYEEKKRAFLEDNVVSPGLRGRGIEPN